MSTRMLPPDTGGHQPQCHMPAWTSDVLPPERIRDVLRQVGEHLVGYEQFVTDADSESTYDLLEGALGDHAPPAQRLPDLTANLSSLLARLLGADRFIRARHPDQDLQPVLDSARRGLENSAEMGTLGHARRVAWAAWSLVELAGEVP